MSNWKNTSQNSGRGAPEQWYERRSYREPSYDAEMDDRWGNERVDTGVGSGHPSLFAVRPNISGLTRLSSSSQVNSNLFNLQSHGGNRNNDSYSNPFSFRDIDRLPLDGGNYNPSYSGRITKNSLVDNMRAKRILQKRALNAVGSGTLVASPFIRRRRPKVRKTQATSNSNENTSKDVKTTKKSDKAPDELRLAIIWVNDTKATISTEQATILAKRLEQLLDEMQVLEEGHVPKFYASGLSSGVYKIVCVDLKSKDWLVEAVENFTDLWEGARFNVIKQSELNNNLLVHVIFTNTFDAIIVLLNRIEKQNRGITTANWRVHRETIEENRRTIVFAIDEQSLNYLKNNEWKLFLGLRQAKFTLGVPPKVVK